MPTVKHNRNDVENNPRKIRDDETARYVADGWLIVSDEVKQEAVETPLPVVEPVAEVAQVDIPAPFAPARVDVPRQRGRPRR